MPLAMQLWSILAIGAIGLSFIVATVVSDRERKHSVDAVHRMAREACRTLSQRAAPLLERGDDLRLAVLAASVADVSAARVLVLARDGRIKLDTGLSLGGQSLEIETGDGLVERAMLDGVGTFEILAPALSNSGFVGEVRLRYRPDVIAKTGYAWDIFGVALICGLSLVLLAWWIVHQWVVQLRDAAARVRAIGTGEAVLGAPSASLNGTALGEISEAVRCANQLVDQERERSRDAGLELARRLVRGLEQRGLAVQGHGERTRRYALLLAEAVGVAPELWDELGTAANLIDLGKAAVRSSALRKSQDLTSVERESLRYAPARGASFLAGLPLTSGVATAIRHHREKYDGTGYPDGLRAERIPLESRILAIADAYDLLTHDTPYSEGMSWPEALDRMHEDRGEHFDPTLLDVFEAEVRRSPSVNDAAESVVVPLERREHSGLRLSPYKIAEDLELEGGDLDRGDLPVNEFDGSVEFEVLGDEPGSGEESSG